MKIYIVQDYDAVVYAGTSLKKAAAKVKGNGCIQVWQDGKCIHWLKFAFQYKKWMVI